jgi:hypothetical protein
MKKNKLFYKKRLMRNKTSAISILVAAVFLFSSAAVAINISDEQGKLNTNEYEMEEHTVSAGLPPVPLSISDAPIASSVNSNTLELSTHKNDDALPASMEPTCWTVAYNGPSGQGTYYFDIEAPSEYTFLQSCTDLMNGGTWTCDERWLVCEHYTGALYEIDPETGDIETIGGGGSGILSLSEDPSSQELYGGWATGSSGGLFIIDSETGEQEYIGDYVNSNWIIGMAIDMDGNAYGWDISPDYFYSIDLTTGEATSIGSLGYNLNYAQDGCFDHENEILYLTAYTLSPYGGYLAIVDVETGAMTLGDSLLGNNAECYGSMIPYTCVPPEHDVKMEEIVKPQDGYAVDPLDIQLRVSNKGNHSEVTDVQFEVIKCEEGPLLHEQHFDTWPDGWETYGWYQSNTHNAVGISPPEAAYTYPPYYSQGWLMSPAVNATGFEKMSMKFRMMLDKGNYANTFFYVQYRKNESSPWRDASPWENPVEDMDPYPWEVGCYGWGEDMGSEFQIRFAFGNYYYYLQYNSGIFIDDVYIIGCAGCAEYAEIVEDVEVPWDDEVLVDFPGWTPTEWQNPDYQDTWEEYPLSAYTLLEDDNHKNDKKQRLLKLYYPFLHDVGSFALGEMESGPAQSFETKAMIKNVGQYEECCFKTHVSISEIDYDNADLLLFEDFSPYYYFPPTGWTRTNTKWTGSYYNYCQQGDGGEARFYYYPSETGMFRLYSPPIDTSGYGAVEISFVHYLNHFSGPYNLLIETSPDGNTWTEVWKMENPNDIFTPEWNYVTTGDNVGGSNFHVSVTFDGYSWNTNWWHVDSVSVYGIPIKEPELTDEMCIQEIIPGEELILEFDDWTPEFLQYETSGVKTYAAKVWTQMDDPEDNHRANDQFQKGVDLQYFHDVGVQQVSAPTGRSDRIFYAVQGGYPGKCIWFDPDTPNIHNTIGNFPSNNFPQGATFVKDVMWLCDTTGQIYKKADPMSPDAEYVGNAGTGELTALAYHEASKTLYGGSSYNLYKIDMDTGKADLIGPFQQAGYYMISLDCDRDGVMYGYDLNYAASQLYTINLETGKATAIGNIGISAMYGQDMAYDWEYETMYACAYNTAVGPEFHEVNLETGKFTKLGNIPAQTTCLAIPGGGIPVDIYVAPGNQNIGAIVANVGTFPERDMTCYATIDEYITDCENATNVYEDMIEGIDILEPLTGTKSLSFKDYLFAEEGPYVITFEIVDDNDDELGNNVMEWGVGCDDTAPSSSHTLEPETPDGLNDYYVSNLNVSLTAFDYPIGCDVDGSGVKEIKYTINGAGGTLPGSSGNFEVTEDGNDIVVEYWAIDWVGNVESKNSFIIDMDQTLPVIDDDGVHWEAFQDGLFGDWYVRFWTNATDVTSDMDRVEMYINEGLHETNASPDGARYDFVIMWSTAFETVTFSWRHFDRAGWDTYDEILGNEPFEKSYSSDTYTLNQKQVRSL